MKRIWTSFFPLLLCATLSAGCANTTSGDAKPKYADFRDYSRLQPASDGNGTERYTDSKQGFKGYN